jgi:hypothetical protein
MSFFLLIEPIKIWHEKRKIGFNDCFAELFSLLIKILLVTQSTMPKLINAYNKKLQSIKFLLLIESIQLENIFEYGREICIHSPKGNNKWPLKVQQ